MRFLRKVIFVSAWISPLSSVSTITLLTLLLSLTACGELEGDPSSDGERKALFSSLDPSGTWSLDQSVSFLITADYEGLEEPLFQTSVFTSEEPQPAQLQIEILEEDHTLIVSGGPFTQEIPEKREFEVTENLSASVFHSLDVTEVSPGCMKEIAVLEVLEFQDGGELTYRYNKGTGFFRSEELPFGCDPFFQSIREQIKTETADEFWTAVFEAGILDLENLEELQLIALSFAWEGVQENVAPTAPARSMQTHKYAAPSFCFISHP
jgi:hypothetical protein